MIRDTPIDRERLERTRAVQISTAGSEFSVAVGLSRLGVGSRFVTRLPDNPYGRLIESIARENGVDASHFVWAPRTDLVGRYLYEVGMTPRVSMGVYQRKYSAASQLAPEQVDWRSVTADARLIHLSGISLGLASHSGYARNFLAESFAAAVSASPAATKISFDFNYRGTLWSADEMRPTVERVIRDSVDILITTVEDLAAFFGFSLGKSSASEVIGGAPFDLSDPEIREFCEKVIKEFDLEVLALTKRGVDSLEQNRWKSAAMKRDGTFAVSPVERKFLVNDRLGGGDAWASGFFFGFLTEGNLEKGILVGDAAISVQQTLFFDLPIFRCSDLETLLASSSMRVQR